MKERVLDLRAIVVRSFFHDGVYVITTWDLMFFIPMFLCVVGIVFNIFRKQ